MIQIDLFTQRGIVPVENVETLNNIMARQQQQQQKQKCKQQQQDKRQKFDNST